MVKSAGKPKVSVVVVVYNIPREAPRTLRSLSARYQRHIDSDDYEVIIVDNGSNPGFDPTVVEDLSGNFRLIRIENASPSPARAVNRRIAEATGEMIGVMVDGARIVTPGFIHFAHQGGQLHANAVVAAPGWYLGYDFQRWAMRYGYDQTCEDELLATIGWPQDGYRLFEIATPDESSVDGWFQPISEANALFMRRSLWQKLGGLDERFDAPGGGLVNLDTSRRICTNRDAAAKPLKIYAIYDRYFADFSGQRVTLLELGVRTGESLKVWSSYFPQGTVIGLDILETTADFFGHPNIIFERGDQADEDRLKAICLAHAPGGLDIIVDDASHIGHHSATSYKTLFPYLNRGGLYIVEDWGTGYFDDWPDGSHLQKFRSEALDGQITKRIPSHDFGMAGFVKSLVDEVAGDNVKPTLDALPTRPNVMSFIHLYKETVIIEKACNRI